MPMFRYKAVSSDGAKVSGVVSAYDRFQAVNQIKEDGSVVLSVEQVLSLPNTGLDLLGGQRVGDKQLSLVCSQFAIILRTGLPVVRAVELIYEQTSDRRLKALLKDVAEDVASGYGLAASFENKGKKLLPTTFIETVRAGEESGTLPESFEKLKTYYSRSAQVKSKAASAMLYPAFLLVLAAVVVAIIMAFAMPTFASVFEGFDMELPGLTKGIIAISNFLNNWWWIVAMLILAAIIAARLYINTEEGALRTSKFLLRVPILGRVNRMKAASQFANTMSTLLTAGIPLIRAVEIVGRVLDNRYIGRQLGAILPFLEEGRGLGEQLRSGAPFLPSMLCEMTAMGEDTGSLESTLDTVGSYYDMETETASNRALSMLQPLITLIMGIFIGILVIGLYLPMFSMYAGM